MKNIARIYEIHRLREENAELRRSLGERWSVIAELREENCLLEKVRDALAKKLNETVSERDALLCFKHAIVMDAEELGAEFAEVLHPNAQELYEGDDDDDNLDNF